MSGPEATTRLERLGPPRLVAAWTTIALSFLVIAFVGGWNAAKYPIALGYDVQPNAMYMHVLLDDHHIPSFSESAESRQPPGYYLLAGLASRFTLHAFDWREARPYHELPEASYRGAQILNVFIVLFTGVLLVLIARLVAPDRPLVWAAAAAFFAFLPVVAKTEAMLHPEPLNMLMATLAMWWTVRLLQRPHIGIRPLLVLAVILAAGLAVRASALFTVGAVVAALLWRVLRGRSLRSRLPSRRTMAVAVAAVVVVVAGIAVASKTSDLAVGVFEPSGRGYASRAHFFDLPTGRMFSDPFRPNYVNAALPETYTEIWGDWIGAFAWSSYAGAPAPKALAILRDQNWIGLLPTALALFGWILLLREALRRRPELAPLVLLPVVALAGYLYRSYVVLSNDGDLFKASYVLTTAPVWSIAFGLGLGSLGRRRLVQLGLVLVFVVFAVLELRFMLYGVRDGRAIF